MSKKKTFETALSELQTIIKELESGSPSLDKMTTLFEDGMKLMSFCRNQLNEVEDRVTTLMKNNDEFIEKSGIDQS
jgi:exodeoxyribonuclease VII small subunit